MMPRKRGIIEIPAKGGARISKGLASRSRNQCAPWGGIQSAPPVAKLVSYTNIRTS